MNDLPMWVGLVIKNKHFSHFFLNLETGGGYTMCVAVKKTNAHKSFQRPFFHRTFEFYSELLDPPKVLKFLKNHRIRFDSIS